MSLKPHSPSAVRRPPGALSEPQALTRYALAGLCTLLVAAATASLFRVNGVKPNPAHVAASGQGEIYFVALGDNPSPDLSHERQQYLADLYSSLSAWLAVMDPTTLFLPNERYGFSQVRMGDFERPQTALPPCELPASPLPASPFVAAAAAPPQALAALLAAALAQRPPALPPLPDGPPASAASPWLGADGRPLPELPGPDPAALAALPPGQLVESHTALAAEPGERLIRVHITRSSGNDVLDRLAQRQLQAFLARLAADKALTPQGRRWLSERHELICNWQAVPGIGLRLPKTGPGLWKEDDWRDYD